MRISVVPSKRLLKLTAWGLLLALAAAVIPTWSGLWLAWLLLLLVVASADALFAPKAKVEVERMFPDRLVVGRWQTVSLRIIHKGGSPVQLLLYDVWPPEMEGEPMVPTQRLGKQQSRICDFSIRPTTHGQYSFGPVYLRQWTGLGLWERRQCVDEKISLRVFPEFTPGRTALEHIRELGDLGLRRTRQRGEGTEFESLRVYQQGDDSVHIDWKASARHGKIVSRQYTIEKDHDVMILLDCGRLMGARFRGTPKLDFAMRAALALAEAGIRLGDRVGLMAFDAHIRAYLPPGHGPGQMASILERVSELHASNDETAFERAVAHLDMNQRKRSLVVVLTDFVDRYTAAPMLQGLMTLARRHAFLFVAVEDPSIEEVITEHPQSRSQMASQAVAYSMRRERAVVLEQLRRSGISVLDLLPDQLTAPMLNQYLELRNRGAL